MHRDTLDVYRSGEQRQSYKFSSFRADNVLKEKRYTTTEKREGIERMNLRILINHKPFI